MSYLCPYENKKYLFENHKQLDDYLETVINKNISSFLIDHPEDYHLLKSFDRAFWYNFIFIQRIVYLKYKKKINEYHEFYEENKNDLNDSDLKNYHDELKVIQDKIIKYVPSLTLDDDDNNHVENCKFGNPNFTGTC
jgi:hypothetical protein